MSHTLVRPELVDCRDRIEAWMYSNVIETNLKNEVKHLLDDGNIKELRDRFYRELEFGTGGLRGLRGAGNNRMNQYVVRRATQGLANYIMDQGTVAMRRGVAIAYDSRIMSKDFAEEASAVLAANGIRVFLFPELQTTPNLSFAVRQLKCIAGICVTASHNPPEYAGFKVYWEDGAQITPPHDEGILHEVFKVTSWDDAKKIPFREALQHGLVTHIKAEVVQAYSNAVKELQLRPEARDLKIAYTPLHGTGAVPAERELKVWGFKDIFTVPEQRDPDGRFPTVKKPNPEEPAALKLLIEHAQKNDCDVAFATDPDSDRLAIVVKDALAAQGAFKHQAIGDYVLLNGNQAGALLIDFVLEGMKATNRLKPQHKIIKTIVTSELHRKICEKHEVDIFDTLTGFKWIANLVRNWELSGKNYIYLFGTEESFGFMPGPYVRDKDGIAALCQASEMTAYYKSQGKTLCTRMTELFEVHGAWYEDLINVDLVGEEGALRIKKIMKSFRQTPKTQFNSVAVKRMYDFQTGSISKLEAGKWSLTAESTHLPASDVLQFELIDGSRISMRPSGTEPKLKCYVSVCTKGAFARSVERCTELRQEILGIIESIS